MKKISYILLFVILSNVVKAQLEVASQENIQKFFQTKTYFVLEDDPFSECNVQLKSAAEKFWKLTPFEIINVAEYEKKKSNPSNSFVSIDEVYFDGQKNMTKYKFLCLYLGGKYKTDSDMPQLCTIPLAYSTEDESNYAYKIGTLLIFIQNHIQTINQHPELKKSSIIDYYQNNLGQLSSKTLYLIPEEIEPKLRTEQAFKKIYPYAFKFVTRNDIEKAIDERNENVVFLHKVGPGNKIGSKTYKILIDTKNATLYYFDNHTVSESKPDVFLEQDVKNLIK